MLECWENGRKKLTANSNYRKIQTVGKIQELEKIRMSGKKIRAS